MPLSSVRADTLVTHAGLDPERNYGIVNPPVYHASTVLFPTLDSLEQANPFEQVYYGRYGTPTTFALEQAVTELEGGYRTVSAASGVSAVTTALVALTRSGDHLLVSDCAYAPTRHFCDHILARFGVKIEYFDPRIGSSIGQLVRPETKAVFLESPGSSTFEISDVSAITRAARAASQHQLYILLDNTWATPLLFRPFEHGVNVSIHSATKYIVGHADAMLGLAVCDQASHRQVKETAGKLGTCAGPDDCYLALRGLRTLSVRLRRHQDNGLALADWLARQPEVSRVIHPARPDHPDHELWRRDFTGACGLFSIVLKTCSRAALAQFLDHMQWFGMGYSWGGFESLILPTNLNSARTATTWNEPGVLLRIHAGLENIDDLISDLDGAFKRLRAAS